MIEKIWNSVSKISRFNYMTRRIRNTSVGKFAFTSTTAVSLFDSLRSIYRHYINNRKYSSYVITTIRTRQVPFTSTVIYTDYSSKWHPPFCLHKCERLKNELRRSSACQMWERGWTWFVRTYSVQYSWILYSNVQ